MLSFTRKAALAGAYLMYSPCAVSCAEQYNYSTMEHLLAETDNYRTVNIHRGDTVRISLPENATTGFRWAIDRYNKEFLGELATESNYTAENVGSGGNIAFIFQGKKIGAGEIVLKKWRSWEGESSIIANYKIRLQVLP